MQLLFTLLILSSLAPVVPGAQESQPVKVSSRSGTKLTWAWKLPCRFRVNETITRVSGKHRRRSEFSYLVTVAAIQGSKNLLVTFSKAEYTCFNGMKVKSMQALRDLTSPFAPFGFMPPIEVTTEGQFVNFVDYAKVLERTLEELATQAGKTGPETQDRKKAAREMSKAKEFEYKSNTLDFWFYLVEAWAGKRLPKAMNRNSFPEIMRWPYDIKIEGKGELEHQGSDPKFPDSVIVRLRVSSFPESASKGVQKLIMKVNAPHVSPADAREEASAVELTLDIQGSLEPRALRWNKIRVERTLSVKGADRPANNKKTIREFRFDWTPKVQDETKQNPREK